MASFSHVLGLSMPELSPKRADKVPDRPMHAKGVVANVSGGGKVLLLNRFNMAATLMSEEATKGVTAAKAPKSIAPPTKLGSFPIWDFN